MHVSVTAPLLSDATEDLFYESCYVIEWEDLISQFYVA